MNLPQRHIQDKPHKNSECLLGRVGMCDIYIYIYTSYMYSQYVNQHMCNHCMHIGLYTCPNITYSPEQTIINNINLHTMESMIHIYIYIYMILKTCKIHGEVWWSYSKNVESTNMIIYLTNINAYSSLNQRIWSSSMNMIHTSPGSPGIPGISRCSDRIRIQGSEMPSAARIPQSPHPKGRCHLQTVGCWLGDVCWVNVGRCIINMYMCVYIYIYMCLYIYIYIQICIYIYIFFVRCLLGDVCWVNVKRYMEVSWNGGTPKWSPKSSIWVGMFHCNPSIWGYHHLWKSPSMYIIYIHICIFSIYIYVYIYICKYIYIYTTFICRLRRITIHKCMIWNMIQIDTNNPNRSRGNLSDGADPGV